MVQKRRGDLPESVKQAVAEVGKAADNVENDLVGPAAPEVTPPVLLQEVVKKHGWQETARRLKLVPKMPQTFSGEQKWKGIAKAAGKTALKSVGASMGYMVVMSVMAAGFAYALRSSDPESLIGSFGSHDS